MYGSGFDLIVFQESELDKPEPVLSCRCLGAKVQIEHSYISLQVNTGVPGIYGCRRKYPEPLQAMEGKAPLGSFALVWVLCSRHFMGGVPWMSTCSISDPSRSTNPV